MMCVVLCGSSFRVRCVLCADCCLMCVVCWWLFAACCNMFVWHAACIVCWLVLVVCCLPLLGACCVLMRVVFARCVLVVVRCSWRTVC